MTWIDPESTKYLSQWKYVEIAHYVPKLDRVIRDQDHKVPIMLERDALDGFRSQNGNLGIYTSVWLYDTIDIDSAKRLGSLYFDFDSENLEDPQNDVKKLVDYLLQVMPEESIRIYFTGAKGFHVECEAVSLGITPSNNLPNLFRYIAEQLREELELSTVDFSVYDQRRMWRLPNSQHQKTNLFKIPLKRADLDLTVDELKGLAKEPREEDIPHLVFNSIANAWYREWSYKQEAAKTISLEERIARFNKMGTNDLRKAYDGDLIFDPEALFKGCPSILALWDKAEREHHLLHEERLFLCSILTYSEEAINYLTTILSNCTDFNLEKSRSHIDDWIRRREMGIGGRPFSCARARSAGVGCGSCDLDPKEKMERVGDNWIGTGEMAEPSAFRFAYRRKITKSNPVMIEQNTIKYI